MWLGTGATTVYIPGNLIVSGNISKDGTSQITGPS
jgi:hypothetical protein